MQSDRERYYRNEDLEEQYEADSLEEDDYIVPFEEEESPEDNFDYDYDLDDVWIPTPEEI